MRPRAAWKVEIRPGPVEFVSTPAGAMESEGSKLTARCEHPRASAENPLSYGDIESKFRTYAEGVLSPSAIAGTIEAVAHLESLPSVRKLMDMLRASAPRGQADRVPLAAVRG